MDVAAKGSTKQGIISSRLLLFILLAKQDTEKYILYLLIHKKQNSDIYAEHDYRF